ncbi:unnamed protein product [Bemisia tabaci]|uniref:Ig-like domain-containing protein n=1 Tax=Bemisia tabaci TaxID=7038 RepID=A0A9P0F145_BEMTA|nr:unnamed protein product [Bemisia tabaci]
MRFFAQSLALRVTFAFSFLIHFSNGQFELDTNAGDNDVPKIEQETPPARELWVETSKGNNITLTCPKLPGSPPAVMELHEPIKTNPGLERKTVISTSGQLSLNNVNYSDAKTYYCTYFTDAARLPTAKIHLNVYDAFSHMSLLRSRRSPAAHKVHHARKNHDSHGHEHAHPHKHSHAQEHEHSQAQEHKHSHAQEHEHSQAQEHKHSHAQEHEHSHAQEHKHSHDRMIMRKELKLLLIMVLMVKQIVKIKKKFPQQPLYPTKTTRTLQKRSIIMRQQLPLRMRSWMPMRTTMMIPIAFPFLSLLHLQTSIN